MADINLIELNCQRCGGELEEKGGNFVCSACGKKWKKENLHGFTDMLEACEEALRAQRIADISNLRQLLWKEAHNEYVSNLKVSEYCTDILKYLPRDFYANFYLATCNKNKTALGEFLTNVDVENHIDDIDLVLDYLLKALKPEWVMGVSNFIEKIKDIDTALYHKYRTWFEEEYQKTEDGVFEPTLQRDVFLAYSSADMPQVMRLVAALERENLSCFVAARNMRHGSGSVENYENLIHTAIDNCSVFVFISSDNSRSLKCDAYREEISYIIERRKNMPRVEYLIQNYSGKAVERNFKNFFKGLEYCLSPEDTAARVTDIVQKLNPEPDNKKSKSNNKKTKPVQISAPEPAPEQVEENSGSNGNNQEEQDSQAKGGLFGSWRQRKEQKEKERRAHEEVKKRLLSLGDYKDLGDGYVTFGIYPQSEKTDKVQIGEEVDNEHGYYLGSDKCFYKWFSGKYYKMEPIKWKVMPRGSEWLTGGNEQFLTSDKILDVHRFNSNFSYREFNNKYDHSEIRKWLNGDFYKNAFTESQMKIISTAMVDNSVQSTGDSDNGNVCGNTNDKVFLLSRLEAAQYYTTDPVRQKQGTDYATACGLRGYNYYSYWWLRSPYYNNRSDAQYVNNQGRFFANDVDVTNFGVVPAIKIKP